MPYADSEEKRARDREAARVRRAKLRGDETIDASSVVRRPVVLSSLISEARATDRTAPPIDELSRQLKLSFVELSVVLGASLAVVYAERQGYRDHPSPKIIRGLVELGFDGEKYRLDYAAWYGNMRLCLTRRAREALKP
jgi:hypothetical protein